MYRHRRCIDNGDSYLWAIERNKSAAWELAASIAPGGNIGRGDATAFTLVGAVVGDCRLDIGRDIRPADASCKDWMTGEVAVVGDWAVAVTSVDTEGAGIEGFPRKKANGVTIVARASIIAEY